MSQILVCDDDEPVRTFLVRLFRRAGFTVDSANNGVEAIELLGRRDYSLLILDLMMPRMNGYDVVAALRDRARRPVVLVLTANSRPAFRDLDADVVQAVLKKPFDLEMLMLVVNGLANTMLGTQRDMTGDGRLEDRV